MRYILTILISLVINAGKTYADSINVEWVKQFTSKTDRRDLVIKTDSEGFIYVAGTFISASQGSEWRLYKLTPAGDTLFTRQFNSSGNGNDFFNGLQIDEYDNVYLTGNYYYSSGKTSFSTAKINKNGTILWQFTSAPLEGSYEGSFIIVDTSSNVYIGGNIINSSSDFFIYKLDSDGDSLWRYRMGTSSDKLIKGLELFNGKIIAACDIYRNNTWDIALIGINANALLQFEEYYDGRSNRDDRCNDITVDENNIYVVGYSENSGNKDYVTIKYASDGRIQWYSVFDDSQKDDEAVSVAKTDDLLIVTGSVFTGQSAAVHKDIVTIAYDSRGVQVWRHKFNGRDSGDDVAVRIINNLNNQIVVACYSWSNQTNYDGYLLNYDIDGNIIWTHSYNDTLNGANLLSDIFIDFLGNSYVTYLTVDTSSVKAEIIKVNQPDKFIGVLKDYLKTLTVGLLDASADSIVQHYVYESCVNAADSLFFITYAALIDSCTTNGYDLKEAMNTKISDFFNLPTRDHVTDIFKRLWVMGNRFSPLLIALHYSHFTPTELEANPKLAYAYEEKDYPIPCLNCNGGTIDKSGTESNVTWGTFLTANPLVYVNGDPSIYITLCSATLDPLVSERCMVCPPSTAGPIGSQQGTSGQNHEIDININYDGYPITDACYKSFIGHPSYPIPLPSYPQVPSNYARVMRVGDLPYFSKFEYGAPIATEERIKKYSNPIQDKLYWSHTTGSTSLLDSQNWLFGDVLTLCQSTTLFTQMGDPTERYSLAHGLYRIDRPGINQKPLFFAFPYSKGIWFTAGPDMSLHYGIDEDFGKYCPPGQRKMAEEYYTEMCEFCYVGPLAIDFPQQTNVWEYIANTNYTTIYDYWSENIIQVGFRANSGNSIPSGLSGIPGLNLHEFQAISNPTPCTPSGTLVGQLELHPGNEYTIIKNFLNNQTFAPGTDLAIHVVANFNNGTSINECRTVTLMSNNPQFPNSTFQNITVNIRGNIKDYNSSTTNYLIEIYQ